MRMWVVLILLGFLSVTSARATTPPASPAEICLAEAGVDSAAARACIGQSAVACIDSDGGATTTGMIQCQDRERAEWRAVRDASVDTLRRRESPTQVALLDNTLTEYERWTQARCAF